VEYDLEVRVDGRRIRTFIDGALINETEHIAPVIEPLYCSASIEDATGDVIVKAVNVQDAEVQAQLQFADLHSDNLLIDVYDMSGYALDEMNSFEAPAKIVPKYKSMQTSGNQVSYEFPKHSVTMFRVRKG
jgi:alpha-L-arabinofuranosidase